MKSTKLPKYNRLFRAALIAAMISHTALAESDKPAYTMMVVSDAPFGQKILSGSFDSAIQELSTRKGRSGEVFETNTNLCVAYAKSRSLEEAKAACGKALALVETKANSGKRTTRAERRKLRSDLSIALSNRGVLFAVEGDLDNAQDSFRTAMELNSHYRIVEKNLARTSFEFE